VVDVPDPGPDPLDEHGEPVPCERRICPQCHEPGGTELVAIGNSGDLYLHPKCKKIWIEDRMAERGA
jgi:hypothetical protein